MSEHTGKIFGVALDVSDDMWSLQLKQAWMEAARNAEGASALDPYDIICRGINDLPGIDLAGKLSIPSWLWPKPLPADSHLITQRNMQRFVESGGLWDIARDVHMFVKKDIFPALPIMIGIDHSATGGVVSALAERYGHDTVSVVVLDRHFDALPLSARLAEDNQYPVNAPENDQYCCGNFWAYLTERNSILPENMTFVGVADYPNQEIRQNDKFIRSYLDFEARGCGFYPQGKFTGQYRDLLGAYLEERIRTPYVYISLDLDVGSYEAVHAARYMDGRGITRQNILDTARAIVDCSHEGRFELVGFDVMEFNTHFIGLETSGGVKDTTIPLVTDFIRTLTQDSID